MDPNQDRVAPVNENNTAYKYFESQWFSKDRVNPIGDNDPFNIKLEPLYQEFRATGLSNVDYIDKIATMRGVKPTRKNLNISLSKCDKPSCSPQDKMQDHVDDLVYQYLSPYLTVPYCNSGHQYDVNYASSPGKFWKRKGCKTKLDALRHPDFEKYLLSTNHIPICDYNGKIELLDQDLIKNGKIRGTFNPPLDFIMKQKFLYDKQNEAIKENNDHTWIKYGYVKQFGGHDRMGKLLEKCHFINDDDCIGYDRVAFLEKVYNLRNKCLQYPKRYEDLLEYVTYYTIHAYVACPDGVIRRRATGNISGSNNTTVDNSILHTIVLMRLITEIFYLLEGRLPTLSEALECAEAYIFSDDNTAGYKFPKHISPEDFYEIKKTVYRKFGFELKPDSHVISKPTGRGGIDINHSFLGSYFHYDEEYNMYVPYPRIEKIASSLLYIVEKHDPLEVLTKAYALTVLSCMVPELGEECRKFLKFLLSKVKNPETVIGHEGMALIDAALNYPRAFYLKLIGKQFGVSCSLFEGGGRNKKDMESTAIANDIPKIEKKIDNLVAKVGGSEEGALWVKEVLDPFNDEPRRVVGFPDLITGSSVVQAIKKSFQITVGATAEDIHIFMDTLDSQSLMYENSILNTNVNTISCDAVAAVSQFSRGGVQVRRGPVGTPLYMQQGTVTAPCALESKYYSSGPTRVLAKAFEVHNTTPQLNVGGSVAVYRQCSSTPCNEHEVINLVNSAGQTVSAAYSRAHLSSPPTVLSDVMILAGAQQWNAKEGCYCVPIMNSQTNNPQEEERMVTYANDGGNASQKVWINAVSVGNATGYPRPVDANDTLLSPFFLSGAYFTGLPPNSTLTVNAIWILERFIDSASELVTLTQPSPYYDPIALELYSKSAGRLPAGVKVGWNADGDWIKNIADVLSTFGVPGMPLVKGAVDLWNGFKSKDDPANNVGRITGSPQFANNSRPQQPRRQRTIIYKNPPPLPPRDYVGAKTVKRVVVKKKPRRRPVK